MSCNVLVADDSTVMRAMIIRILRLSGLPLGEVYEAHNGREGLNVLNEKQVHLALVDIDMPIMGGAEMIENVRTSQSMANLPVIAVSTESSMARIEHIRQKNVEFIHKPFTPEVLRKKVLTLAGMADEHFSRTNPLSEGGPDF